MVQGLNPRPPPQEIHPSTQLTVSHLHPQSSDVLTTGSTENFLDLLLSQVSSCPKAQLL